MSPAFAKPACRRGRATAPRLPAGRGRHELTAISNSIPMSHEPCLAGRQASTMNNISFLTSNPNKHREFVEILGFDITRVDAEVPEIQSMQLEEVVRAKAEAAFRFTGSPVIVEDVSLEIHAWGGLPGPFVKFFLHTMGVEGIARRVALEEDQSVVARELVDLFDGVEHHLFEGVAKGTVADAPRGESGFGFDKIFIPEGSDKTYGEMTASEKNRISHRAMALSKLKAFMADGSWEESNLRAYRVRLSLSKPASRAGRDLIWFCA